MDALYFPHLSLPASTWVNPALLFFDQLAVIVPEGRHRDLFDPRTHELIECGMVRPEVPGWDHDQDREFLSYMLGRASGPKRAHKFARVHAGKLSYGSLARMLMEAGLLANAQDEWLEGPDWVIAHLMSYLALQISLHANRPLPLITDEIAAGRIVAGPRERAIVSRRLQAVTRLLPVPPDARISDIEKFRLGHRSELENFRNYVNILITLDSDNDEGFQRRLRDAEAVRGHLTAEMASFDWRETSNAIAITAITTFAASLDQSPWSVGAGLLGIGLIGAQALSLGNRRQRAGDSRMVYATKVVQRWPPTAAQTLW